MAFKANNQLVEYNDLNRIEIRKIPQSNPNDKWMYNLEASTQVDYLSMCIYSFNDVKNGNYYIKSNGTYEATEGKINAIFYGGTLNDFSSVSIVKVDNGYATGTFNGSLTNTFGLTILITDGVFKNVKILQ